MNDSGIVPIESGEMGAAIEAALMKNDYSKLTPEQKVVVYRRVCESVGLNYMTNPFGFYRQKDGTEKMYAQRTCADQLRAIHGVSLVEMREEFRDDVFSVIVSMRTKDGRQDIDRGDVFVGGLKGLDLANARMRAMTKAKRRCTLSLCGLGWLDESEVQDSPGLRVVAAVAPPAKTPPVAESTPSAADDLRAKLRAAFAKKVQVSGIPGRDLAKEITARFSVENLDALTPDVGASILTWLTTEPNG